MKRLFMAFSIIILLIFVYFIVNNLNNAMSLNLVLLNGVVLPKTVKVSSYTLLIALGGIFAGAGTVYMFLSATKDKVKAYQRELEKSSVSGQNNASKVDVLEAKIKTLEKAFNSVIDERTQLEVQIKTLNAEIDNLNKKSK